MKRGFTLIELLAVITILSLLVLITSMTVANLTKESKDELTITQINLIKAAAKTWGADNVTKLPNGNSCSYLLLKDLKEYGLLDTDLKNPKDKENLSDELKIRIGSKLNSSGKSILTYEVNPSSISGCTYIGNPIYVDIPTGLTPVIYDGDNWRVPQIDEEWYNYDEQKWANAVVLGKGKTKKPGEIVTVEGDNPDALMMLVYIPRYEYKIEGTYGTHPNGDAGTPETPGEIKVNFIWKGTKTPTSGYHIHPAFTFGDKNLSGIWVGKFEISHTTKSKGMVFTDSNSNLNCQNENCSEAQYLRIIPGVPSLRYNSAASFWYALRSIENINLFGLSNVDTHMMKNSEWGAVAYLSQSKYGKYGNSDYEGINKEIYQNTSQGYITGSSNGVALREPIYNQCTYNQKKGENTNQDQNNCGMGASTTGNIYGIYDMSGGSYEDVMGVYLVENTQLSDTGFSDENFSVDNKNSIHPKYYDKYLTSNTDSACNGTCYGHALSETLYWYSDSNTELYIGYPLLQRGGVYTSSNAGIFYFHYVTGLDNNQVSTRLTIIEK